MDRVENSKCTTTFRVHYKNILMMVSLDIFYTFLKDDTISWTAKQENKRQRKSGVSFPPLPRPSG